nr:hypothetical protein BaRGS_014674 [Batillaria attramentaria]
MPTAGIKLLNVAASGTGNYSVHVNINLHGSVVTETQTVGVQVNGKHTTSLAPFYGKRGDFKMRHSLGHRVFQWKVPLCTDVLAYHSESGVYTLHLDPDTPVQVYCDQETDGLENMYRMTNESQFHLRVDLWDFDNNTAYAEYDWFNLTDGDTFYKLNAVWYNGTAGDAIGFPSMEQQNWPFTAPNWDHDGWPLGNCGDYDHGNGGWWFGKNCGMSFFYWGGGEEEEEEGASVRITGYDARFAIMDARMRELQRQNADLIHTVQTLTTHPVTATGQPLNWDLVQEVRNLTAQNRDLTSRLDSALQIINQQAHQLQNLTAEVDRIRGQQASMTTDIGLLKYLDGVPLRVGDRVKRGKDWDWQNQNAGIDLRNVTMRDSGTYTVYVNYNLHGESHSETQTVVVVVSAPPVIQGDGHLEVRQLPNPVYDSLTQEWHVQLSCNGLVNLGSPPVSMVWVTPSGTVLPSTSNINGNFTLTVPNLPETGDYTCVPSNSSKSASCLGSSSPFHSGAAVHVDGVDARFRILESHMSLLLEENAALLQKVDNLSASNSFMGAALLAEERTNAELSQNVSSMAASIHVLQAENMNLKSEVDALSHQVVTLTGLEVGDRVVRGRDWDYSDQGGTGPGTVTAVPAPGRPGWVRVRWDTGEENNYRWGADGKFDLLRIP